MKRGRKEESDAEPQGGPIQEDAAQGSVRYSNNFVSLSALEKLVSRISLT